MGQSTQPFAFVPELYVSAGHNSQVMLLLKFRKEPVGQTKHFEEKAVFLNSKESYLLFHF